MENGNQRRNRLILGSATPFSPTGAQQERVTFKNSHHVSDVTALKGARGGRGEGVPGGSRKLDLEASCVNAGESEPEEKNHSQPDKKQQLAATRRTNFAVSVYRIASEGEERFLRAEIRKVSFSGNIYTFFMKRASVASISAAKEEEKAMEGHQILAKSGRNCHFNTFNCTLVQIGTEKTKSGGSVCGFPTPKFFLIRRTCRRTDTEKAPAGIQTQNCARKTPEIA